MSTWAVIATGQSLLSTDVKYLRGKCRTVAVSDAYKLAPWADCLVSHDRAWWREHQDALEFAGEKICRNEFPGVKTFKSIPSACNSGLMGMYYAQTQGATKILLLGFDMHGSHYFGAHPKPLQNTDSKGFARHIRQFDKWAGCEVINCTVGSHLKRFPYIPLRDII